MRCRKIDAGKKHQELHTTELDRIRARLGPRKRASFKPLCAYPKPRAVPVHNLDSVDNPALERGSGTVTACSCTLEYRYRSFSTYQRNQSEAWYADFDYGLTSGDYKTNSYCVRAVRAGS